MNLRSIILSRDGHLRLQVFSSQYVLCSHFGMVCSISIFLVCKGSFFNHSKLQGVWNLHAFIKYYGACLSLSCSSCCLLQEQEYFRFAISET